MSDDLRARADARLDAALAAGPFRDPRPYLRPLLRYLRERKPPAFARALEHYESALIPDVAGGEDALAAWLTYGRLLAELAGEGRILAIDPSGRAAPAPGQPSGDALLLYLPEDADTPAAVLRCPRDATPAQDASIELLVLGRVSVSERLSGIAGRSAE